MSSCNGSKLVVVLFDSSDLYFNFVILDFTAQLEVCMPSAYACRLGLASSTQHSIEATSSQNVLFPSVRFDESKYPAGCEL